MSKFSPKVHSLVEKGKFNYGVYKENILNVNPLDADGLIGSITPKFIKDNALKEWNSYQITDDRFSIYIILFSLKKSSNIQIVIYDRIEDDTYTYSIDKPLFRVDIGKSILNSNVFYKDESVMLEISNKLENGCVEINFEVFNYNNTNIKGNLTGAKDLINPLISCIPFENNRAMYSHRQLMNVGGSLLIDENFYKLSSNASMIASDQKSFYPHEFWWNQSSASMKNENGIFAFNLTENQSLFPSKYNENCFWIDEKINLLPAVTFLFDRSKNIWKIVDEKGNIDLTFKVKVNFEVYKNYFISKSDYKTCFGVFNGFITDLNGNKIEIKNYFGLGEVVDITI
ncbi:DUF2804 family protein [Helicovermis profundi]|uniref:Uncharacterized protein n=1 Tax=Helicovermis profundi TaxID=3065157 RepID=A0AAU9E3I7_9FIRM|nr:hypothetical protein HLPR_14700 [Clostridia bacterium S502]